MQRHRRVTILICWFLYIPGHLIIVIFCYISWRHVYQHTLMITIPWILQMRKHFWYNWSRLWSRPESIPLCDKTSLLKPVMNCRADCEHRASETRRRDINTLSLIFICEVCREKKQIMTPWDEYYFGITGSMSWERVCCFFGCQNCLVARRSSLWKMGKHWFKKKNLKRNPKLW